MSNMGSMETILNTKGVSHTCFFTLVEDIFWIKNVEVEYILFFNKLKYIIKKIKIKSLGI